MDMEAYYALGPAKIVRRVPPPFPPERLELYRLKAPPGQVAALPEGPYAMVLHSRPGELIVWALAFGRSNGFTLENLIQFTLHVYRPEIEGSAEVLGLELHGDLVIRPGPTEQEYLGAIKEVVEEAWPTRRLSIEFRDVDRPTTVLNGRWVFNPLDAIARERRQLEIYGSDLNEDRNTGGGGTGGVREFAGSLGRWIGSQVLVEADEIPARVSWHFNEPASESDQTRALAHHRDLVLNHLQEQSGLKWSDQIRRVRRLFVELT